MSVTFTWTVSHCSGVEGENEREAFLLNSLVWNLIIQLQSDSSPYCKRVGQTLAGPCKGLQQCQPAWNLDRPAGQGSLEQKRKRPARKDPCHTTGPAQKLHHQHNQEEKMANGYFFGHPFITVWALESIGLDKFLVVFFCLVGFLRVTWTVLGFIPGQIRNC